MKVKKSWDRKEAGRRAARTTIERHGKQHFAKAGKLGGKMRNPNKGFGNDPDLARKIGALGLNKRYGGNYG